MVIHGATPSNEPIRSKGKVPKPKPKKAVDGSIISRLVGTKSAAKARGAGKKRG